MIGAQLNWHTRENECYGIFNGMKLFEAELDGRYFISRTDHKNLTCINSAFVGKILRWKLYLHDKNFSLEHVASLMLDNKSGPKRRPMMTVLALQPIQKIPQLIYKTISRVHNSEVGHWGLQKCKQRLSDFTISDRMIAEFIRQCPCCQVMSRLKIPIKTHRLTYATYSPFEVIHLDHIGPLRQDDWSNSYILVLIDAFSR